MENVYILFFYDDEYGHKDFYGAFRNLASLLNWFHTNKPRGHSVIKSWQNEVNFINEKEEEGIFLAISGERFFWEEVEVF